MGRFQSWYASKKDAQATFKARKKKMIETFVAEVFNKKSGESIAYYVGLRKTIKGLEDKYLVKLLDWK